MITINLVFWLMALICFVCAAAKYEPGISMGWLGAAFIALIMIISLASGAPGVR